MIKIFFKIIRYPFRFFIKLKFFKEADIKNKFSIIYKNNYWDNKESFSGPGSTLENTKNLRNILNKIIKKYNIKSILDAPCGDCNWIQSVVKKNNVKYIGIDIVKALCDSELIKDMFRSYSFAHCALWLSASRCPA